MTEIAALLSYDSQPHVEPFESMLKWAEPPFAKKLSKVRKLHQFQNLSLGASPAENYACNEARKVCVALTGSIFSKHELHKGSHTITDAFFVLETYLRHGSDCFAMLDGEFAILLLDEEKGELFAVRDRLGIYPLYWFTCPNCTLISTSLKGILATGFVSPTPDITGIASMLSQGFISQDVTCLEKVNRLLPGYILRLNLSGHYSIQPFWSFSSKFAIHYSSKFDSSLEIYCELERQINEAIGKRIRPNPSCLASSVGSLFIEKRVGPECDLYTPKMTPKEFLDSLIPMIWAMEMPNAESSAPFSFQFIKKCAQEGQTPYFDTGFTEEFYDYSKEVKSLKEWNARTFQFTEESILWKFGFKLFPVYFLKRLRKTLRAKPELSFFQQKLIFSQSEFAKAAPELSRHFDLDQFIHEFYHLSRFSKLDPSLFYLSIKTFVADGQSDGRQRIADSFGLHAESPFLDFRLLEFFASFSPDVWASPDLVAAFPSFWLEQNERTFKIEPTLGLEELLLAPEVWPYVRGLESGLLVESGYVQKSWIKKALNQPQRYLKAIYTLFILELWMKLFIDMPLREANPTLPISDLITPK